MKTRVRQRFDHPAPPILQGLAGNLAAGRQTPGAPITASARLNPVPSTLMAEPPAEAVLPGAEEQLRILTRAVEQCPVSIVLTDVKGDIEYVNPKFTALTGYSLAEALGKNPRILKTDDLPPEAYRNLWETIMAGEVWQGEFHNRKKNGESYWESATISPVFDAGGRITHFLAIKEDTTERKQAGLELLRTNRALKMLSSTQDALLHAQSESALLGQVCEIAVICGGYHASYVGYALEDETHTVKIMAQSGQEIGYLSKIKINWDERSPLGSGPVGQTIRGGQPVVCADMESDPSFLPWRETASQHGLRSCICLPLRAGGRTLGVLGLYSAEVNQAGPEEIKLLQDLANALAFGIEHLRAKLDRQEAEQQLLRAQRMDSLGTLAGGLAHDLNNALAPILMAIDILKLEIQDPGLLETLATMRSSAQRGADMVKQVLSFARGTDGQRLPVKLSYLVEESRKIIADTFPRNIQIEVMSRRGLWNIKADSTQLHQVIMNLCLNARDAMPKGGKLTLKLENQMLDEVFVRMNPLARPGPYVTLQVTDTGTGIPPEIQPRIFEPFFTTKEFGRGSGLGLSTALGLVKGHGGFIHCYSEAGRGATFKLFFPALTENTANDAVETEPAGLPAGHGELILVVDDEEQLRTIVNQTLERFGYRVVLAQNGAEAVAIYGQNRNKIAAVLTDMDMPIMDGPSTIIALQSMNPQLTIIGSSGLPVNGHVTKALGAGVKHFVPKPYSAGTLLRVLAQALADAKAPSA